MLYLKEINFDDIEKEYLFVREIPVDENGFTNLIGKEHRGHGYATEGLRMTLELARKIVPEEEIYLRVNKDNPASLAVMLKNDGRIDHEDETKYFVRVGK